MDAVRTLTEMGIAEDVAREALRRAGGDVEAAGSLLFAGELGEPGGLDEVGAGISENEVQSAHVELPAPAGAGSGFAPGDLDVYVDEDGAALDESCCKAQISAPTVVAPLPPNFVFENYCALFCLFVANYLPQLVARPDFGDLGYDREWYRGHGARRPARQLALAAGAAEEVAIVPREPVVGGDQEYTQQPELLWQLQRLAAVANSRISDRAFVRARMFALALEPQVQRGLADAEHLYEVLPAFVKSLAVDLEMCPGFHDDEVRRLFISSAFHAPAGAALAPQPPTKTWLSLFHFLPEEYDTNLYRMFHVLLYPDDTVDDDEQLPGGFEDENENSLCDIAPVLTVVFDEMDETTDSVPLAEGVEIPLEFYPQLYTRECKDKLIKDIIAKRRQSQRDSRALLQEIANLKSFQGKDILKFVNSSLDYLQKDGKPVDDLLDVKDRIAEQKRRRMDEYKKLAHRLQTEWNLSHPEIQIVQSAREMGLVDEPYLLTMAVISPYMYYMRDRNDQWFYVRSHPQEPGTHVRACSSPLEVQDSVKQYTRQPSEWPLMFIYCKKGFIPDDETVWRALEQNQGCSKFAKDDQLQLNRLQMQSSSSASVASASAPPAL